MSRELDADKIARRAAADEAEWADTLAMARQNRQLDAAVAEKVMGAKYLAETCPQYSTDIAAAWLVVERMKELGWHYNACTSSTRSLHRFEFQRALVRDKCAHEKTLPMAICKAALEARK